MVIIDDMVEYDRIVIIDHSVGFHRMAGEQF